jgi:hypothetical protein
MIGRWIVFSALIWCYVWPMVALASEHRSREITREFQREHPCPSTSKTTGACPGYRKDHIIPLGCGGPDAVSNLQWQRSPPPNPKTVGNSGSAGIRISVSPRGSRNDHIDRSASAFGADQPLAPFENGGRRAVALSHLVGVGLNLMRGAGAVMVGTAGRQGAGDGLPGRLLPAFRRRECIP